MIGDRAGTAPSRRHPCPRQAELDAVLPPSRFSTQCVTLKSQYRAVPKQAARPTRAVRFGLGGWVRWSNNPSPPLSFPPPTAAIAELLPKTIWQRCHVHFLRKALDYLSRRADDDCMRELRWLNDRRDPPEAGQDLATWLKKWQHKYPRLCDWVENDIEETLSFYRLPRQRHKRVKSSHVLERIDEEIERRTHVVRIFPNGDNCLRMIRALAIETHDNWTEATGNKGRRRCKTRRPETRWRCRISICRT